MIIQKQKDERQANMAAWNIYAPFDGTAFGKGTLHGIERGEKDSAMLVQLSASCVFNLKIP